MKATVAAGLVAATVAQECCLSTTVQDAFPLFCEAESGYTQGSHCEAGTTCCDLFEIPNDAGGFDCCSQGYSCHECENEDHCDLLAGQKNFCALDLTCVPGQGERRAADMESADNSLEGCQALCESIAECQAFDYTLNAQDDACRLYYGFYESRIGDVGRDDRMYCEYPPPPTPARGDAHYDCEVGQGERGEAFSSGNSNSEEECAAACDASDACAAFDYTTNSQGDSCRLYTADQTPRIGNGGGDNRMYCVYHDGMDTETTGTSDGHYDCEVGQGERGEAFSSGNYNSEEECAAACDASDMCVAFDYTTNSQGDSCRLYTADQTPRIGNGGDDNRMYCVYHDGMDTETTETPDTPDADEGAYFCQSGQGERGASFTSTSDNSYSGCAGQCDISTGCVGFDYTTSSQSDACRLFGANDVRIGNAGGDNRMYCGAVAVRNIPLYFEGITGR